MERDLTSITTSEVHDVDERLTVLKSGEVGEKRAGLVEEFAVIAAAGVLHEQRVGAGPERMVGWEWFLRGDVEHRTANPVG